MKKFLAIIAIASFAIACNGSGEKTETKDTTVVTPVDTLSTPKVDTTTPPAVDTTAAKKDTTSK